MQKRGLNLGILAAGFALVALIILAYYFIELEKKGMTGDVVYLPQEISGSLPHYKLDHSSHPGMEGNVNKAEWIPDFSAFPTKTAVKNGKWDDTATWNGNVPGKEDIVLIPNGITVVYEGESEYVKTIGIKGTLTFSSDKNAKMKVGTVLVHPAGRLRIRPDENVKHEVVFSGTLNTKEDPGQYGIGIVAVGGSVDVSGREINDTFAKIERAKAGEKEIILTEEPKGWKKGDEIFMAEGKMDWHYDSYQNKNAYNYWAESEKAVVDDLSGRVVKLKEPLKYEHTTTVADITRNVIFRSENPEDLMKRGHILFTGDNRAKVRYARIEGMGRTTTAILDDTSRNADGSASKIGKNQRGRYALHAHHPHNEFLFEGNAIVSKEDSLIHGGEMRWCITSHNAFGNITKNVVIGCEGAGIASEYGTETGPIEKNLVIGLGGGTGERDAARLDANGNKLSKYDFGHGGIGYWFGGQFNEVKNNIADGYFRFASYYYYPYWYGRHEDFPVTNPLGSPEKFPDVEGMNEKFKGKNALIGFTPLEKFENQVSYAQVESGYSLRYDWQESAYPMSVIKNYVSYHAGIYTFETEGIKLDGVKLYGDGIIPSIYETKGYGFYPEITTRLVEIENSHIEGFSTGIIPPLTSLLIKNSVLNNAKDIGEPLKRVPTDKYPVIDISNSEGNFNIPAPQSLGIEGKDRTFFRGINFGGPQMAIDGNSWESGNSGNYKLSPDHEGKNEDKIENGAEKDVKLNPDNSLKEKMLKSVIYASGGSSPVDKWGRNVTLTNVPDGVYDVYLYVLSDRCKTLSAEGPCDYLSGNIQVGDVIDKGVYSTGEIGTWQKLGPWRVKPNNGEINIWVFTHNYDLLALSGVEVWKWQDKAGVRKANDIPDVNAGSSEGEDAVDENLVGFGEAEKKETLWDKFVKAVKGAFGKG